MNTAEVVAGYAEARRERQRLAVIDLERRRLLEACDVAQGEREDGVLPADGNRVGIDIGHIRRAEAALNAKRCGVDVHVEDGAREHVGLAVAGDGQLLRQKHRPALLRLLHDFVAVSRLDAHAVRHHEIGSRQRLHATPGARDVAHHGPGAPLAIGDERDHHEEGNEEQKNEKGDQEELECGAARDASCGLSDIRHMLAFLLDPCLVLEL